MLLHLLGPQRHPLERPGGRCFAAPNRGDWRCHRTVCRGNRCWRLSSASVPCVSGKRERGAGYCAARLFDRSGDGGRRDPCRCACFSVIFKLGRVGTCAIRSVFLPRLAFNTHLHCGESLRLFSPKPSAEFKDYLNNKQEWMCNSSVTSKLCFQLQLTGPSAEAQVQLRFGPFSVRFPLTLCPFTIKAPKHILNKLFKSVCFAKLILNHT